MEKAIESLDIQARMSHPIDEKFKQLIISISIDNCSVVPNDVTNACTLFGTNHPGLIGKTFLHRPERVVLEYLDIP